MGEFLFSTYSFPLVQSHVQYLHRKNEFVEIFFYFIYLLHFRTLLWERVVHCQISKITLETDMEFFIFIVAMVSTMEKKKLSFITTILKKEIFLKRLYLFLERRMGKDRGRETLICDRNINCLPLAHPQTGT